jgi:hypothetical protein
MSETTPTPAGPPAGWYPHPSMSGTQAYWDGARWTSHVAPAAPAQATVQRPSEDYSGLYTAGWITALLLPLVGFIIGAVLCTKPGYGNKGAGVMIVALMFFLIYASMVWS